MTALRIGPPPASVRLLELDGGVSPYHGESRRALIPNGPAGGSRRPAGGARTLDELDGPRTAAGRRVDAAATRQAVERALPRPSNAGFLPG